MEKSLEYERKFYTAKVFKPNPKGFVIMDTVNNPKYPLKRIHLDKSKPDMLPVLEDFRTRYHYTKHEIFMPWHFQVELVGRDYVIINTRPHNYKSRYPEWEEHIVIMIVGDSSQDLYLPDIYKKIANMCILPYTKVGPNRTPNKIEYINVGREFSRNQLEKYI